MESIGGLPPKLFADFLGGFALARDYHVPVLGDEFGRACQRLGIKHLKNPAYSPQRNGKVERLHRTLHEECYWRYSLLGKSLQEVNYCIQQYLSFYNYQRRHSGMGMNNITPFARLTSYLTNLPLTQPADINLTVVQALTRAALFIIMECHASIGLLTEYNPKTMPWTESSLEIPGKWLLLGASPVGRMGLHGRRRMYEELRRLR